jgi:hypothetical protein
MTAHTNPNNLPLKMEHVVVLGNFPPAQKRSIALAFTGHPAYKDQAAIERVSPDAIKARIERVADTLRLPWGNRSLQHIMAELCRRHLVEFICIVIALLPLLLALNFQDPSALRTRRSIRRMARNRAEIAWDVDTLKDMEDITQWLKTSA